MMKSIALMALFTAAFSVAAQKRMTPELLWKLGRVGLEDVSPDGKTAIYGVTFFKLEDDSNTRELWSMPTAGGEATKLTDFKNSCSNALFRPDGQKIVFLNDSKIWEMGTDGSKQRAVSPLEVEGFKWSADGQKILFAMRLKMDKSTADIYPDLSKSAGRSMDGLMYRHWKNWSDGKYSNLFIADYHDGLPLGTAKNIQNEPFHSPMPPFGGMEQTTFSPDGRFVVYASKKLKGTAAATSTNADIYVYEISSGKTLNMSEGLGGYDLDPVFSPDGRFLIWTSMEKAGYEADRTRLMALDLMTQQREEWTAGWDFECNHPQFSRDGKTIFFLSSKESTYHLFKMNVADRKIEQITDGIFNLENVKILDEKTAIAQRTSMVDPAEIVSISLKNGSIKQLSNVNTELLKDIEKPKIEKRWVETFDKKRMLTWVIVPPNFDSKKKYASILMCQGGPQTPLAQSFSYRWNFDLMASQDYVVVAPVRRGCVGMGQKWTDEINQDWGGGAMQDLLSAADALQKESFIDPKAMGAAGASFGGYSVYWLAGNHKKRFNAFISHCGMFNMESWYGTTEELFFANNDLGEPYWSPKAGETWAKDSPHKYVQNWDTPMLVIHNEKDYRVPIGEGMQAFQAAQLRGIPSEFLYFPDEGHWMSKPQNSVLWQRSFFKFLDKHLKKKV